MPDHRTGAPVLQRLFCSAFEELWQRLAIPHANIRTPFTEIDGTVILGNDRRRLEEVLAGRA